MFFNDHRGRYGREEFLLVFLPCAKGKVRHAAQRLLHVVTETPILSTSDPQKEVNETISIGTASTEGHQIDSIEELFKQADDTLYRAKGSGRNQVSIG